MLLLLLLEAELLLAMLEGDKVEELGDAESSALGRVHMSDSGARVDEQRIARRAHVPLQLLAHALRRLLAASACEDRLGESIERLERLHKERTYLSERRLETVTLQPQIERHSQELSTLLHMHEPPQLRLHYLHTTRRHRRQR